MGRLDEITLEELHGVREQTEGEKPRERVLAAIGRKQGDQINTLAERHGVVEKTIRNTSLLSTFCGMFSIVIVLVVRRLSS